ncbi:unnamed protein product [Parnassius apollo]|uniref:(apollo) hypothetical protein n=1 Tax=Parnassius apollo TaxID=110799 RepID=A0A8S3XG63_PARAO|nr:unnamed protein product [Parnassius apollo]
MAFRTSPNILITTPTTSVRASSTVVGTYGVCVAGAAPSQTETDEFQAEKRLKPGYRTSSSDSESTSSSPSPMPERKLDIPITRHNNPHNHHHQQSSRRASQPRPKIWTKNPCRGRRQHRTRMQHSSRAQNDAATISTNNGTTTTH